MVEAGETAESLAAQTGVDPKTAARWTTPGRVPQPRRRVQVATILGWDVEDLWPDVVKRREPEWLREWVDWEREAVAVRWFEHTRIPGLLQTEEYARATLAGEALTPGEVDELVASRISRQAILRTDRPRCRPPSSSRGCSTSRPTSTVRRPRRSSASPPTLLP